MFPYVTSPGKKPKETALSQVKSQAAELRGQSHLSSLLTTALSERNPIPGLNKRKMEAILPTGCSPKDYQFPQSSDFKKGRLGSPANPWPPDDTPLASTDWTLS